MWFGSLFASVKSGLSRSRRPQPRQPRRGTRLVLEHLEDRALPSAYTAATVSNLIADIQAANTAGGANTITLAAPTTSPYVLTAGQLNVAANDNLTILGNGDTIERSTAAGTPAFRLLFVGIGVSLTLQNLTLQHGLANNGIGSVDGGAIYSLGALTLNGVTVQNNQALGLSGSGIINGAPPSPGGNGLGGGLYIGGGTATLTNVTLSSNTAEGGQGGPNGLPFLNHGLGAAGGNGCGGGLEVAGGTVSLTNCTLSSNTAQGGLGGTGDGEGDNAGGKGGNGYGGALQVIAGTVSLTGSTLSTNSAQGGNGGNMFGFSINGIFGPGGGGLGGGLEVAGGTLTSSSDTLSSNVAQPGKNGPDNFTPLVADGGGIYIASGAILYLDSFTVANTINNRAYADPNIDGTYILTTPAGAPTVVNAASANPSPVTGTTTNLSVLGNDPAGQSSLTSTWAVTGAPAGAATPTFSSNGSNASQNTTATFSRAGTYTFQVTLTDPSGLTASSSVTVTVVQTVTSLSVTPGNVTLANGKTQQFTALALDQFGQALTTPPTFTWQVSSSSGGTISSTGLYTAPKKGTGTFQVEVSADGLNALANITLT